MITATAAAAALKARRHRYPLAYSTLWDNPEPMTSQRRALLPLADPKTLVLAILGGNRSGKSAVMARWLVANALGRDYRVKEQHGDVYPVLRWLDLNRLPYDLIPEGPGECWAASPNFSVACDQIRPHIRKMCPEGTRFVGWDHAAGAQVVFPNGGKITSKAYREFSNDPQTWEGASLRALGLDEQPDSSANFLAGLSRLIDQNGKMVVALTYLRGKRGWFYREVIGPAALAANPEYRTSSLWGEHNPHIPQEALARIMSKYPAWQRAARARGEVVDAEGAVYPMSQSMHVIQPFTIPAAWPRFLAIDWGGRAPHVLWATLASDPLELPDGHRVEQGDIICYREFAPRLSMTQPRLTQGALIEEIRRMEAEGEPPHALIYRIADSEDPNAIENAAAMGVICDPVRKGKGVMTHGIGLVEGLLQCVDVAGDGTETPRRPSLYFTTACPVTVDEMMALHWPDDAVTDDPDERKPADGADHGPDCVRYIAQYLEEGRWR